MTRDSKLLPIAPPTPYGRQTNSHWFSDLLLLVKERDLEEISIILNQWTYQSFPGY